MAPGVRGALGEHAAWRVEGEDIRGYGAVTTQSLRMAETRVLGIAGISETVIPRPVLQYRLGHTSRYDEFVTLYNMSSKLWWDCEKKIGMLLKRTSLGTSVLLLDKPEYHSLKIWLSHFLHVAVQNSYGYTGSTDRRHFKRLNYYH